jgi:hypothetical protein
VVFFRAQARINCLIHTIGLESVGVGLRPDGIGSMPRTSDYFLDCVLYIYGSRPSAVENDEKVGGSGFLAAAEVEGFSKVFQFYAVTAAHVIRKSKTPFLRLNKRFSEEIEVIEAPASSWVQHSDGDDISVCPLQFSSARLKTLGIETGRFVTSDIMATEDIGIGDDVFMVGRFAQHSGSRTRNIPVVRFGNISTMPGEPIERPDGIKQESFLVECRSIPGHSGAPVFIYKPQDFEPPNQVSPITGLKVVQWNGVRQLISNSYWLLGIDWCHLQDPETKSNTGMAGVIPAWKILEVLNSAELVKKRRQEAERISSNQ